MVRFFLAYCWPMFLVGALAHADDEPYGNDTLPTMIQRSAFVVQAGSSEKVSPSEARTGRVLFYELTVESMLYRNSRLLEKLKELNRSLPGSPTYLQPEPDPGRRIFAIVPISFTNSPHEINFKDSLVFLSPPSSRAAWESQLPAEARKKEYPIYVVVSGGNGVLPKSSEQQSHRFTASAEFIEAMNDNKPEPILLDWAKRYYRDKDPFLWRSALLEAEDLGRKGYQSDDVFKLFNEILNSTDPAYASRKLVVIQSAASTRENQARNFQKNQVPDLLIKYATKQGEPRDLREAAVTALWRFPDGKVFVNWLRGYAEDKNDVVLAQTVKQVQERYPLPRGSSDEGKELRALHNDIRRLEAILKKEDATLSDKLAAVRAVAQYPTLDDAAIVLAQVARDKGQPDLVRSNAILDIAEMGRTDILRALGEDLGSSSELGKLAIGLSRH